MRRYASAFLGSSAFWQSGLAVFLYVYSHDDRGKLFGLYVQH